MRRLILILFTSLVVSASAQDYPSDLLRRSVFQFFDQSDYNSIIQKGSKYAFPGKWRHGVIQIFNDYRELIEPNHGFRVLTYQELEIFNLLEYAARSDPEEELTQQVMGYLFNFFTGFIKSNTSYKVGEEYTDDEILNLRLQLLSSYIRNDIVSTLTYLDALLEADPDNLAANSLKGSISFSLGNWQDCLSSYSRTTEISPDYAYGYFMQGLAFVELGNLGDAEVSLKKSLKYFPHNQIVTSRLGHLYMQEERFEEAIGPLRKTILLDPSNYWIHGELGSCYQALGQSDSALFYLDKAIKMKPEDPFYYSVMGDVYYKKEEFGAAKYLYSKSIERDSGFVQAWISRGDASFRIRQFEEAKADFQKALAIDSTNSYAAQKIGSCYFLNDQPDEAIAAYDIAIQIDSSNHYLYFVKGMCYAKLGDDDAAFNCIKKSVSLDSTYVPALTNLGWSCYLKGDYQKCLDYSMQARMLDPEQDIAGFNSALALLRLGRIDESYEMYRDLVAQHGGIDLSGVAGDLTDLINKNIMVKEARYILRNILNLK
jgi:tetratricopeptide (TPR) repeat protein